MSSRRSNNSSQLLGKHRELLSLPSKADFHDAAETHIANVRANGAITVWEDKLIDLLITTIQEYYSFKHRGIRREWHHYNAFKNYDIKTVGQRVIHMHKNRKNPEDQVEIANYKHYYHILIKAHTETGHGGRDAILRYLRPKLKMPVWAVRVFLEQCPTCKKDDQPKSKKPKVIKPIINQNYNDHAQVYLVDFQSAQDKGFKWVLHYQEHLTKFSILRPLRTKRVTEVAVELRDIFSTFGCPRVLHSDNGREFVNGVVSELVQQWPGCTTRHGRPRHPECQGSIERGNQHVEKILKAYLADNQTTPTVQYRKNTSFHRIIKQSPFQALFGVPPVTGDFSHRDSSDEADDPDGGTLRHLFCI